jgi:hypothetical protein
MITNDYRWLLECDEPWTRYRTYKDLLDRTDDEPEVEQARLDMVNHTMVKDLIKETSTWPGYALKRHNDTKHPIYKFSTLADFGVQAEDPGMAIGVNAVFDHQSVDGAFQTMVNIPRAFGGTDEDMWTWILCDSPTLLYSLSAMGNSDNEQVLEAANHLAGLVEDNGFRCTSSPDLGKFKGPGRRSDPCPIANVYALKALAQFPHLVDSTATRIGAEMLLNHWEIQRGKKYFLFGIGTDFRKLKYPFVWYDILHVTDTLSQYPYIHADPRFVDMVSTIIAQADENGRYTATSMYRAWKDWSFADKKNPSPWLTFIVLRIQKRILNSHFPLEETKDPYV